MRNTGKQGARVRVAQKGWPHAG